MSKTSTRPAMSVHVPQPQADARAATISTLVTHAQGAIEFKAADRPDVCAVAGCGRFSYLVGSLPNIGEIGFVCLVCRADSERLQELAARAISRSIRGRTRARARR